MINDLRNETSQKLGIWPTALAYFGNGHEEPINEQGPDGLGTLGVYQADDFRCIS